MPDIKTKDMLKRTIQTANKSALSGERMKRAYIRTKENVQHNASSEENSSEEYATDRITGYMNVVSRETVRQIGRQGRNGVKAASETIAKGKVCRETGNAEDIQNPPVRESPQTEFPKQPSLEPAPPAYQQQAKRHTQQKAQKKVEKQTREQAVQQTEQPIPHSSKPRFTLVEPSAANQSQSIKPQADPVECGETASRESAIKLPKCKTEVPQKTIQTVHRTESQVQEHAAQQTGQRVSLFQERTVKPAKYRIKAEKNTVKTAERIVKNSNQSATATIHTSQATARKAQETTQATTAVQKAQAAARSVSETVKAVSKNNATAVRISIRNTRAMGSAVAAGSFTAVVVVVIVCMIGLIVGSSFGIFFSGEDTGTGQTMQTAVREINEDYEGQLASIKENVAYDTLEMSGSCAVWPEVLSVYAVKTTTALDNAQDVVSMDDSRKAILVDIFWQMNEISYRVETTEETVIAETDDGSGNIVETGTTVTHTTLYITVTHKTADEMADQFGFDDDQRAQLGALLSDDNSSLWAAVLYGIGTSDDQIVSVALSQVGNVGGEPYWSWYGFTSRVEWCACFVSWCADQCGYIDAGMIPKFAGCSYGVQWFRDRGQWADGTIEPTAGMIIFFDWDNPPGQDGSANHVGIVEKVENGIIYTIEGNSNNACRQRQYPVGYYEILGYGIPAY